MTNERLKLAFIGGGINSAVGYAHYCASHLDGRFKLVAGAFSRDKAINQQTAEQYNVDAVYDDWRMLLEQEKYNIDAVVILTPTPSHFEIIDACFNNGVAVICEKAVTMNKGECAALLKSQRQNNAYIGVTYNYSGYPMVRELKSLIQSGKLGEVLHIQAEMPQEGFTRLLADNKKPCPQAWRLQDETIPTIYLDLAVHLHHLVHFATELKPLSTIATQNSYGWFDDIVDDVSATVEYENSVKCQYWFSKSSLGHRNGLRIKVYGNKGAAEWVQAFPEQLTIDYANGRKEILERGADCLVAEELRYNRFKAGHPAGFIEAFANLYTDFANQITQFKNENTVQRNNLYGLEVSLQGMELLETMVKSHGSRQWEHLSE